MRSPSEKSVEALDPAPAKWSQFVDWVERNRCGGVLYLIRRIADLGGGIVRITVFTTLSTALFHARCFCRGMKCGKGLDVYGHILMRGPPGTIEIHDEVQMLSSSWRCTAAAAHPVRLRTYFPQARIILERRASLSGTSITARSTTIRICEGAMFGPDCIVMDSDFHAPWPADQRRRSHGFDRDAAITIGRNAWVGTRSIILKGVSIGDGAIIGAGSIVTHSIPPNAIAVGNPAKVIEVHSGDSVEARARVTSLRPGTELMGQ